MLGVRSVPSGVSNVPGTVRGYKRPAPHPPTPNAEDTCFKLVCFGFPFPHILNLPLHTESQANAYTKDTYLAGDY